MVYAKFLLVVFLLFYLDCGSVKNNEPLQNQTVPQTIPDDLLITLERTNCYGSCPAYKLSVKSDGTASFEGLDFTKIKGKAEDKISVEKVNQLVKAFENSDYFNLNGKYDTQNCYQWTDAPSATTSIQINGKIKSIVHYQGCREGSDDFKKELSKLTKLENKIDEIVETKRWIGERK
ncbi:MAG: DUF6438 domain-containing protein [Acidobacteriota bacterium]|nr:DUF6438 domain-containing protein [Acidobacteriota bacterium]